MARNEWIAMADDALAVWDVTAPDELALVDAILRVGADHDVFRVATEPVEGGPGEPFDYLAHLRGRAQPFALGWEEAPPGRRFVTPGRVCWYGGEGGVEQGEVADLGALLRQLHPEVELRERYLAHVAPLEVSRTPYAIRLALHTDLWFPRVIGLLDDDARPFPTPPARDNAELAACHTPRLNAFLREVRDHAEHAGGSWRQVEIEGIGRRYAELTSESGVQL